MSGLAGALGAFAGGFGAARNAKKDREEREANNARLDGVLTRMESLGATPMPMGVMGGGGGADSGRAGSYGAGGKPVDPAYIRAGLIQRGMPDYIADAFIVNMRDESGLDADINERAPIVPGSRGGYGLYQVTGPRRRQMEAFAAQAGKPLYDPDLQMDFLMHELKTTEAGAAKRIYAAPDKAQAAVAIVDHFLRPAPQHEQARIARYKTLVQQPAPTVQSVMNRYPRPMGVQ